MKVCYVDESGTHEELPLVVMVGVNDSPEREKSLQEVHDSRIARRVSA